MPIEMKRTPSQAPSHVKGVETNKMSSAVSGSDRLSGQPGSALFRPRCFGLTHSRRSTSPVLGGINVGYISVLWARRQGLEHHDLPSEVLIRRARWRSARGLGAEDKDTARLDGLLPGLAGKGSPLRSRTSGGKRPGTARNERQIGGINTIPKDSQGAPDGLRRLKQGSE